MNKKEILATYAANLPPESRQRNLYLKYAQEFLGYADDLSKEAVMRHIERLKRQDKSPGTINFIFRIIRRLFIVNKVEWPYRHGEAPLVDESTMYQPVLDEAIVEEMISSAKNGKLDEEEVSFLALSTIFGLRREELATIEPADIDMASSIIRIRAAKGEKMRVHLIPEEIKPHLIVETFSKTRSLRQMSEIFWYIVNACDMVDLKQYRLGWHTIRRLVPKLLREAGVDPVAVHCFMGWSGARQDLAMDIHYHSTVTITLQGKKAVMDRAKSDREIYEKHPLLLLWR